MLRLIANIGLNRPQQRRTNTERPIPLLPFKLTPKPARRIGLQLLHDLCQSQRSRQPDEQMYMVSSSTRSQNLESQIVRDTNQISVKLLLRLNRNPIATSFGTENTMDEVRRVRMRHSTALNLNVTGSHFKRDKHLTEFRKREHEWTQKKIAEAEESRKRRNSPAPHVSAGTAGKKGTESRKRRNPLAPHVSAGTPQERRTESLQGRHRASTQSAPKRLNLKVPSSGRQSCPQTLSTPAPP